VNSGQATTPTPTPAKRSRSTAGSLAPAPGEHELTVERVIKRFGERVGFADVSSEVGYGEVFGFLGPLAWRVVAAMFDRERLVTARHGRPTPALASVAEHPQTPFRTTGDQQWQQH